MSPQKTGTEARPQDQRLKLGRGARLGALLLGLVLAATLVSWLRFPSDKTPEGAYLRVVKAVNRGEAALFFAYIEEAAQHACYTIRDYRKASLERARAAYPPEELARLDEEMGALARAPDGADVFAFYAQEEGWLSQLRRDVSGIARVEQVNERATIETARGTRYAFRVRPNGIWGMTAFTATLVEEAERAARDRELVEKAALDFERSLGARAPRAE